MHFRKSADRGRVLVLALFVALAAPGMASGQLTSEDRERLVAGMEAAAAELDPSLFPSLDHWQQRVTESLDSVDRMLRRDADQQNRQAWWAYLDVEQLREAIEREEPALALGREALAVRNRMVGVAAGLERKELTEMRDALSGLIDAVRFRDAPKSTALITAQLDRLAEHIRSLGDTPTAQELGTIAAITGLIKSSRQAEAVVSDLRATFDRPNVAMLISRPLIQEIMLRDVNQTRPVRDSILGTRLVGTAHLTGVISAELVPSQDSALMRVTLNGEVHTENRGFNGPVRLRTQSGAVVSATRMVHLTGNGIRMDEATAEADLWSRIRSIDNKLGIVRHIARKRAAEQKPLADRIATERMRRQVAEQFTSQTDDAANVPRPDRVASARAMLERLALAEPSRRWTSTSETMFADLVFRGEDQIATVTPRPPVNAPFQLAVQIHESAINNLASPVLAGRTFDERKLDELLGRFFGSETTSSEGVPAATATDGNGQERDPDEEESPFEIDFANLQPIVFAAREQAVRIGVRGTRFSQGRRELKRSMEITATYRPVRRESGQVVLVRDEEIDVQFPGRGRLTIAQAGLKPTIQRNFAEAFPMELLHRTQVVPESVTIESMRGREFRSVLVESENGWLTVGLE